MLVPIDPIPTLFPYEVWVMFPDGGWLGNEPINIKYLLAAETEYKLTENTNLVYVDFIV